MPESTSLRELGYIRLDEITQAHRNPKTHNGDAIRRSVQRFGFTAPLIIDERTGRLVAGHGRLACLTEIRDEGASPPSGITIANDGEWLVPVVRGWASRSDADADALMIADNRLTELGGWDDTELADMLSRIEDAEPELVDVAGYSAAELTELRDTLAALDAAQDDEDDDEDRSGLLGLSGLTVGEPAHRPETGQVWALGRHRLVLGDPFTGHVVWAALLTADAIFLPYPTMLAPFAKRATTSPLVMVQPDKYIAGHMLDKWQRVTGDTPQLLDSEPAA